MLYRDILVSCFNIIFGKLLPDLPQPKANLAGKNVIVTGANSGIGLQLATQCARYGATVCLACRNDTKARDAVNTIVWRVPEAYGRVFAMNLDTSNLDSVKIFAEAWSSRESKTIDILFHNAGIASTPEDKAVTADGFPAIYATNLLGPFLLTHFLEPYLSFNARVVLTSTTGQYGGMITPIFSTTKSKEVDEPGYHYRSSLKGGRTISVDNDEGRYCQSKMMCGAFVRLLQRRFDKIAALDAAKTAQSASNNNLEKGMIDIRTSRRRIAHAFTPGFTVSQIFNKIPSSGGWFWADPTPAWTILKSTVNYVATDVAQGSMTGAWLATTNDPGVVGEGNGGRYWDRMVRRISIADMLDDETLERLWKRWEAEAGIEWR